MKERGSNSIKFWSKLDISTYRLRSKLLSQRICWLNTDLKIPEKWCRLHAIGLLNFFCWQIITLLFFTCQYHKSREKRYLRVCYKFSLGKHLLFSYPQGWYSRIGLNSRSSLWKEQIILKIPPTTQRFFSNTDKNSKNVVIKLKKTLIILVFVCKFSFFSSGTSNVWSWKVFFIPATNEKKKTLLLFMDTSYCSSWKRHKLQPSFVYVRTFNYYEPPSMVSGVFKKSTRYFNVVQATIGFKDG